ncbi:uncharacterized protein LOC100116034 [Nasonia vitripennis]|uniref:CHK kinase-like domain-containing protein n=1 Tax=Nasonia vitripennis TaxID=7425 RepID=A0A7M7IM35_NASVI|nr:uncharacterized protein LOC100116034 [Nasonia vitripennis]
MAEEKSAEFLLLTKEDVSTVVENSLGSAFKLIDYKITNFSDRILGFMGAHRLLSVRVREETSTNEETHSYFVKCLPPTNEEQSRVLQSVNFFYKEANFYSHILPKLTASIGDHSWCPRSYLVKGSNLVVLENLATKNYIVKDKLLDIESLKSALVAMAKLHGSTVLAEKRLGKTFLELHPKALEESLCINQGYTKEWYRTGLDVAAAVAEKLGLNATLIPKICDRTFEALSTLKMRQNVICHGDAWSFNFMFKDSPLAPNCVMMDFQIIRYAPAVIDVAQFFYYTMRREFREKNEYQLLRHYYDEFAKILKIDEEVVVPSFSQILEEFELCRIVGVVSAVLQLPLTMVDDEVGADIFSDAGGFARLVYLDRVDLVLDIMKKDSSYNDRIVESVKEMVERSKKLLGEIIQ